MDLISTRINVTDIYDWIIQNKGKSILLTLSSYLSLRYIVLKLQRKYYNYPPGPIGFPIIGYFPQRIIGYLILRMQRYSDKGFSDYYGPISMFHSFRYTVIISNSALAKKLLSIRPSNTSKLIKPHALNRQKYYPHSILVHHTDDGTSSFAFEPEYNKWIKRRKLINTALVSMCTSSYVNDIIEEIMYKTVFVEIDQLINNKANKLFFPKRLMRYCAFNTIFHSSFGYSSDIDDKDGILLRQYFDDTFRLMISPKAISWNLLFYRIGTLFVDPSKSIFYPSKTVALREKRSDLIRKLIKKREFGEYDTNNPTSFIDRMLKALENEKITRSEMEADVLIMFAAGTDTTSATLEFAIIYAAKYPEIQYKVRQELLEKFKNETKNNKIKFDIGQLSKLPLFRAYIKEVQRLGSVAEKTIPHRTSDDLEIEWDGKKYIIPKDAMILFNIHDVNLDDRKDVENWKNGKNEICLENWLDENGSFKPNKSDIIFGHGYRDCVGKMIAMKELFIIMGYLLLNYKFELENKDIEITTTFIPALQIWPEIGVKITKYE